MVVWLVSVALGADCPTSVPPAALGAALDAAEVGFAALSPDDFANHLDEASLLLPCLDAAVAPSLAARWHGLVGLRLFSTGRTADARASFAAATAADGSWTLSDALVPPAHEVRSLIADPGVGDGTAPLEPPASGVFVVDGRESDVRPTERPTVVQWVDGSHVEFTADLWPGDALPAYPRAAPVVASASEPTVARRQPKWAFLAVGGAAAATSAVLYGLGASTQHTLLEGDTELTLAEAEQLQSRNHVFVASSAAVAGVAAAGFVTFAVVR